MKDKVHGAQILNMRKQLAFAGFTHKSPRFVSYVRADDAFDVEDERKPRGPAATVRTPRPSTIRARAMSL